MVLPSSTLRSDLPSWTQLSQLSKSAYPLVDSFMLALSTDVVASRTMVPVRRYLHWIAKLSLMMEEITLMVMVTEPTTMRQRCKEANRTPSDVTRHRKKAVAHEHVCAEDITVTLSDNLDDLDDLDPGMLSVLSEEDFDDAMSFGSDEDVPRRVADSEPREPCPPISLSSPSPHLYRYTRGLSGILNAWFEPTPYTEMTSLPSLGSDADAYLRAHGYDRQSVMFISWTGQKSNSINQFLDYYKPFGGIPVAELEYLWTLIKKSSAAEAESPN
ncbi:hypothetical protein OBBRIDRAFT_807638 [Obba rivulosa]|uniref:Uncharacterized protein n=1 Tax=Obba rivulosa TaxID=1052685 RepID=A0A8E2ANK7_9APHY|nr:hypothetical protein OBBRIDRAFT_807638 [Obba rivulosa]